MSREVTANVGRGRVIMQGRAFAKILRLTGPQGTVGFQEIGAADGPIDEAKHLRAVFAKAIWRTAGMKTKSPISWNRLVWECLGVEKIKVGAGIPNVSPAQYVNVVRLRHRITGKKKTRINTHFVAGAWNGKTDPKERERRDHWADHWVKLSGIVAAEALDANVVLGGDFNRQRFAIAKIHPRAVLAAKSHTDYLLAIPMSGFKVKVGRVEKVPLGIDFHEAIGAQIKFVPSR